MPDASLPAPIRRGGATGHRCPVRLSLRTIVWDTMSHTIVLRYVGVDIDMSKTLRFDNILTIKNLQSGHRCPRRQLLDHRAGHRCPSRQLWDNRAGPEGIVLARSDNRSEPGSIVSIMLRLLFPKVYKDSPVQF